jgi:hypothetical protein
LALRVISLLRGNSIAFGLKADIWAGFYISATSPTAAAAWLRLLEIVRFCSGEAMRH